MPSLPVSGSQPQSETLAGISSLTQSCWHRGQVWAETNFQSLSHCCLISSAFALPTSLLAIDFPPWYTEASHTPTKLLASVAHPLTDGGCVASRFDFRNCCSRVFFADVTQAGNTAILPPPQPLWSGPLPSWGHFNSKDLPREILGRGYFQCKPSSNLLTV